jgi:hypothetical protein
MAKEIWVAYNHMPGGQVVVTHFKTVVRKRKIGDDKVEEVTFTAETQLEGFKKSDFVELKLKGKDRVKHEVLVFPVNEDLPVDPAPAVIAYATRMGIEPIKSAAEQQKQTASEEKVIALENQISNLQGQITQMMEMMKGQFPALKPVATEDGNAAGKTVTSTPEGKK